MAQTNVQSFSGDVEISSNLAVDTNTLFVDSVNNRVGVGLTNPSTKLHIGSGDVGIDRDQKFDFGAGYSANWYIKQKSADNKLYFERTGGSGNELVIDTSGNVGIGTSTPNFGMLSIYTGSTTKAGLSIDRYGSGNYRSEFYQADTGLAIYVGHDTTAPNEKMRITHEGRVGIGTTTVRVPLHVNGGNSPSISSGGRAFFAFFDAGGGNTLILNTSIWGETTSIYASHSIVCGSYLASLQGTIGASDKRIKKDITDVDDGSALETLRLLKPKKYKYVDEVQRGTDPVWGFIAQEVDATLPYATQVRTECIPNIYELANVSDSNVITFTNFDTSNLYSNTMVLKVYDVEGMEHLVNIAEVVDGTSIRIEEDLSKLTGSVDETGNAITQTETTTLTLEEYEALALDDNTNYVLGESNTYTKTTTTNIGNNLFVYGQEVSDFLFLKKEAIFTVATAALQEVDRQLQAERVKVATLETQVASVLTRLDALESA